ncbi:ribonuclease HI family protein [Haloquadratum walsbyi]|jgi:Ribonuclease HI|uniref:Ribonuclease HI n=1 Tax=Haloquadratum walsbyi J07HQW2 TaxID=1238425 RepID=U1NJW6_9EURY|nr:ribonuclease HI family protein [Haloquadratum walsbyi]ERG97253.1 MAG: ribonuclease HI [Haloquadratum walsbyi J07HQW2]
MSADKTRLILVADGASGNNQSKTDRKAGIGYIVSAGGTEITEQSQLLGEGEQYTNNLAEYQAIIRGLEWIQNEYDSSGVSVNIHTDSELLVRQVRGECDTNASHLVEQRNTVQNLLSDFGESSVEHVSETEENLISRADTLATEATQQ